MLEFKEILLLILLLTCYPIGILIKKNTSEELENKKFRKYLNLASISLFVLFIILAFSYLNQIYYKIIAGFLLVGLIILFFAQFNKKKEFTYVLDILSGILFAPIISIQIFFILIYLSSLMDFSIRENSIKDFFVFFIATLVAVFVL